MSVTRVEPAGADGTQRVEQGPIPAPGLRVPWPTVLPLAVVLAFADGFWIISLRAPVGALERTESPPPGCARPPSPCRSSSSPCSAQSPWPCTWWLEVDLWGPDGRTDYTLEATAVETPDGSRLNVRDIHVMSHRPHLENATLRLIAASRFPTPA
jgi:hypothetical protein